MKTLALLLLLSPLAWGLAIFDVHDYGATGDGHTKDTAAIAKATAACTGAGGGTVYLPPGRYLTGPVVLKSHVTLALEKIRPTKEERQLNSCILRRIRSMNRIPLD